MLEASIHERVTVARRGTNCQELLCVEPARTCDRYRGPSAAARRSHSAQLPRVNRLTRTREAENPYGRAQYECCHKCPNHEVRDRRSGDENQATSDDDSQVCQHVRCGEYPARRHVRPSFAVFPEQTHANDVGNESYRSRQDHREGCWVTPEGYPTQQLAHQRQPEYRLQQSCDESAALRCCCRAERATAPRLMP